MAKAKLRYKTKAEKQAALDQADAQFERARNSLFKQGAGSYQSSVRNYYINKGLSRSNADYAADNARFERRLELGRAYENRINAIEQAAVGG